VEFRTIHRADLQAGGPNHDFRIGRYEIRNDQFATFLNDAYAAKATPQGYYLYHDVDSGSVYINDAQLGDEGVLAPLGTLSVQVYDATVGRIRFESSRHDHYVTEPGFEEHPVVGVSWHGAVKFCNWLTIQAGMPLEEQAYVEGPRADDWISVAFDPADPASNKHGYRLPMDGGTPGAGAYNEWHKAATAMTDADGATAFTARFGFGRDALGSRDANFLRSGDAQDDDTTPAGFFNGVRLLGDGVTPTRNTENAYSLYDLCGNVAEWMHDLSPSGKMRLGATRGGHFLHPSTFAALRTDAREVLPADSTFMFVGFRVAQSLLPTAPVVTQTDSIVRVTGFVGGPLSPDTFALQVLNPAPYTLDSYTIVDDAAWLEGGESVPLDLPPGASVDVPMRLTDAAYQLSVSPRPPGSFALVRGDDLQEGGPDYDYWVSTTEVTNDQFVVFLNDAFVHPADARGSYTYHDVDSGSTYLHGVETGASGTDAPSEEHSIHLYDAEIGRIRFGGGQYAVEEGFGRHPVVGVSWFGAVKYCNWLTLFAGLPEGMRAYGEGPSANDWRPITVAPEAWATRGIDDAERALLIETTVGYRLPMDHATDAAAPFNEWHKAASGRTGPDGVTVFDALYGFGRDSLSPSDANFVASGDTVDDQTTLVGFFDGSNVLDDDATMTRSSDNAYGMLDMCGNVAEWTVDFFSPGDSALRSVRGGSWLEPPGSAALPTTGRRGLRPEDRNSYTGFRVIRGTGHVATISVHDAISDSRQNRHVILDLQEPLEVRPFAGFEIAGTYCDDFGGRSTQYTVSSRSALTMPWSVQINPPIAWLTAATAADGHQSGELPPPDGSVAIQVRSTTAANDLPPGDHLADMVFTNPRTGTQFTRPARLSIAQPIVVHADANNQAELANLWRGPFDELPPLSFSLTRAAEADQTCALDYSVSATVAWLSATAMPPFSELTGPLPPSADTIGVSVRINDSTEALDVGEHEGEVLFTFHDQANPSLQPPPLRHAIKLTIEEPTAVTSESEPWTICCRLFADEMPSRPYALTNAHPTFAMPVRASADVPWIEFDSDELTILPGGTINIHATLNEQAPQSHGEYDATIAFANIATGQVHARSVRLRIVESLTVSPLRDVVLGAQQGGPIMPTHSIYRLENMGGDAATPAEWQAASDQPWVVINGASRTSGMLEANERSFVTITVDAALTPPVPPETQEQVFEATVTFDDLTHVESFARRVILTVVRPRFSLHERAIPAADLQPGGPDYSYQMGQYHITNAQFVEFLNDAMANPEHPRGQFVYVDSDTGDVYINDAAIGQAGPGHEGRTRKMFAPGAAQQIQFLAGRYGVATDSIDYSLHPAAGVSWYGAVKFCNWLTLDQGMPVQERCYTEGPVDDVNGWRPVTIEAASWVARDLIDAERDRLVRACRGFRLPMDDGYNNAVASVDSADDYNEWFKAAAWSSARRQNTIYGFGRDNLSGADANFRCSGDSFESTADCLLGGTTPMAYFAPNENSFDLFDMTGNVHQWLQDRYAPSSTLDRRTIRGGSWNDPIASQALRNPARILFAPPETTSSQIGFRVLRVPLIADGDFDGDGGVDLDDFAFFVNCLTGAHAAYAPMCATFDPDADGDVDLLDAAALMIQFDPWAP